MKALKKNHKPVPGNVYAIPLPSGGYGIAVVCCGGDTAVFDYKSDDAMFPDKVLDLTLAFRVPVATDAPVSGCWLHIGNVQLEGVYAQPGRYLHKPIGSPDFYIYSSGVSSLASKEEAIDLEILSTWFSYHVVERLEDHLQGRKYKYSAVIDKQLGIER